ncbi:GvpL/GvpF family gas vesicle protein [Nocardioidaceae bacterium]|nr:GvpL/GvpF family gas vesicle protein [Nocardioidaceae bacterium]
MTEAATARYAYAVTRGAAEGALAGTTGIHGAPVEVVTRGELQALVSDVPLEEFDEEPLRRHLEDLRWVEQVARAHDDVVRAAHGAAVVAPLSLATIFHDDDGVRDRLLADGARLGAALDAVEGCDEFSVKVLRRASSTGTAASSAESRPASGADYLRRKREAAAHRVRAEQAAADFAVAVHDALAAEAAASRRLAPQDPRLSALDGVMTLNAAYLVRRESSNGFAEALKAVQDRAGESGADEVSVAGPWPPYSFVTLDGT